MTSMVSVTVPYVCPVFSIWFEFDTDNKYVLYITGTLTPKTENNAERRESLILKQTHFSVNNGIEQHGNILT
jgi:hypothetical protein